MQSTPSFHGATPPLKAGDVVYYSNAPMRVMGCVRFNRFCEWRASLRHMLSGVEIELPCRILKPLRDALEVIDGDIGANIVALPRQRNLQPVIQGGAV